MTILDAFLIGIALAMDAFALTVANCTTYKDKLCKRQLWSMPVAFGLFQFLMPVLGFYIGSVFSSYLSGIAGFLSAGIFFLLFIKIVIDNVKESKCEQESCPCTGKFNLKFLLVQAVATSIDAFLIGACQFALFLSSPFFFALIVGVVTFAIVSIAIYIGKTLGAVLGKFATWTGAFILLALSIKDLISAIV
jgi:putative Mn2+ efflux pump MntP